MKKFLLVSLFVSFVLLGFSQNPRVPFSASLRHIAVAEYPTEKSGTYNQNPAGTHQKQSPASANEEEIGMTGYDLQSNACTPYGRFHIFDDGTMGAVWTRGTGGDPFTDRGTGYNYFNGTSWGAEPASRIENVRTGWPSYAALGANGEIIIAHQRATLPLIISKRTNKGSGDWSFSSFSGPDGHQLLWPRMVTGGTDHNYIHLFGLTAPSGNGGSPYQGQDGALVYSRSTDGGVNWDMNNIILDGMGSSNYVCYYEDMYSWVEPKGDNLAFIVCDPRNDLFVMRSADAGATWQKTVIWQHPYPHWNGISATDTFYRPDGSAHGVFDNNGKLHIVFGIDRAYANGTTRYWFPFEDGIAYWNEDHPSWTGGTTDQQCNCLNPDLLYEQGSLVGWIQDINGNGQIDLVDSTVHVLANYGLNPSSMPQLTIDENNNIFLLFSGITETFDNGNQQYRHIWSRASYDGGQSWGNFQDLTGDVLHSYDECAFPSIAALTDDKVHCIYQADAEPGICLGLDHGCYGDNYIRHLSAYLTSPPPPFYCISGIITYANGYPIPCLSINLKDANGTIIATTTTDISGNYSFCNLTNGTYTLEPSTCTSWGGVSAADVLLYKKHIANIAPLTGIFLTSGDVNASGELSATDVLLIKKRIAYVINSFPSGDWLFSNITPVTINGGNVTLNIYGLCYGDANASYVPQNKMSTGK